MHVGACTLPTSLAPQSKVIIARHTDWFGRKQKVMVGTGPCLENRSFSGLFLFFRVERNIFYSFFFDFEFCFANCSISVSFFISFFLVLVFWNTFLSTYALWLFLFPHSLVCRSFSLSFFRSFAYWRAACIFTHVFVASLVVVVSVDCCGLLLRVGVVSCMQFDCFFKSFLSPASLRLC